MIKLYYQNVIGTLALCLFACYSTSAYAPKWSAGYPKAINGATSIDLNFNVDQNCTIYYVAYTTQPVNATPSSIKNDALASLGGTISKNGTLAAKSLLDHKVFINGLTDGKTYFIYTVAENANGEIQTATDIKKFMISLPVRHSANSYKTTHIPNGGIVGYLAYFPEEYYKNPTANYPVLIYLHGEGERTTVTDNINLLDLVKTHGPPQLIEKGQEFPFIVISPQCPFTSWDNTSAGTKPGFLVDEVVEMIKSTYRVDLNKIFLTGSSMGGTATFSYIQNFPNKIAASIPIAGTGDLAKACVLKDAAVWAFQGENDGSQHIVNLIAQINVCKTTAVEQAKATIYAGGGHDAWTATYNNTGAGIAPENIYDWLMRHSKNGTTVNQSPVAKAGADITATLPLSSLKISGSGTDADGTIASYSWAQLSGPTITLSGANTAVLNVTALVKGTFTFRLTVTDNAGASSFDEVSIIINAAPVLNQAPVVSAGADKSIQLPLAALTISGTASDNDGTISSSVWTQQSGPSASMAGANTSTLSLSALVAGTYVFRFTATDNQSASSFDEVSVTVVPLVSNPPTVLNISGLVLADADKSVEIGPFATGYVLNLAASATKNYTILAKTSTTDIGSIVFSLDGGIYRIEDKAPFSMTGNCYPGYNCYGAYWRPSVGSHTMSATAYSGTRGTGTKGTTLTVNFTVTNTVAAAALMPDLTPSELVLTELVLADADKSVALSTLADGSSINLSSLGVKNYTVLAKTNSTGIGSVVFHLDGGLFRIEDKAPFSLTGNCYPGYHCYGAYWQPSVGKHVVTATAYSLPNGEGTKGTSITSTFNVVSSSSRASAEEQTTVFSAAPNPFVDELFVSLPFNQTEHVQISIINDLGTPVYQQTVTGGNQQAVQLDVSHVSLHSGLYILQVASENGEIKSTKVIKQ